VKRDVIKCDGSVIYELWDGEHNRCHTETKPCKAPAAFKIFDGHHLCSIHARGLFTDYALSQRYAKRMFGEPEHHGPRLHVFDTPKSQIPPSTSSIEKGGISETKP